MAQKMPSPSIVRRKTYFGETLRSNWRNAESIIMWMGGASPSRYASIFSRSQSARIASHAEVSESFCMIGPHVLYHVTHI